MIEGRMIEEITDERAYRCLLAAIEGWSISKQDAVDLLDSASGWPAALPKLPGWLFERIEAEKSHDYATADRARRARRQRAARILLWIVAEQSRAEDLTAAAETLARMLARGKTRSQSRLEARVRPDGRLQRPDARQSARS